MSRKITTIQGDTWDMIAKRLYDDEYCMDQLIDANPQYADIVIFSAGTELTAPEITSTARSAPPPWRSDE